MPPLQKALAQQRNLLATLTGRLPSQRAGRALRLADLRLPQELPLSLPSKMVEQRPDVRAAEANLHSASAPGRRRHRQPVPAASRSMPASTPQSLGARHAVRARPGRLRASAPASCRPSRRRRAGGQEAGGAGRRSSRPTRSTARPSSAPSATSPTRLRALEYDALTLRAAVAAEQRRGDQPHHRAAPARARRHDLRLRADRRAHLSAGAARRACRRRPAATPTPRRCSRRWAAAGGIATEPSPTSGRTAALPAAGAGRIADGSAADMQ